MEGVACGSGRGIAPCERRCIVDNLPAGLSISCARIRRPPAKPAWWTMANSQCRQKPTPSSSPGRSLCASR